jgi:CRISPR-associated protein Cas2
MTDKQYERIISFQGRMAMPPKKTPDQFDLF